MKTRREFFKTLAGSCAVVAACVVAPKSLMAKPATVKAQWAEGHPKLDYVTSGYAQAVEKEPGNIQSWTFTGDKYLWHYVDPKTGEWIKT